MKKKIKSLGQIAWEEWFPAQPKAWSRLDSLARNDYERMARAVEREVLRRAKKAKK